MTIRSRHSTTARRLVTVSLVVLAACYTSPLPKRAAMRDTHRGEIATVRMVNGTERTGELLGVQDSSIVLLVGNRVARGTLANIAVVLVGGAPSRQITMGSGETLTRLARASRFPFGITAYTLSVLLDQAKQSTPDALATRTP
ncbi:MAG: hypothetical protein IPF98_09795 [Gemmatimonadetes bacterium]|nr:hypothetical protein [Gemmatimonadota bacterium]MCC6772322.1 hypothetical protein [Gemmatimonadaceae bacterium]